MTKAWVIRSGRYGERDSWALENGVSGGGWMEVQDLTICQTREDVAVIVAAAFGGESDGLIANYTGQMWALRGRIDIGDLVVMPMKTTKQIALGRCTGGYEYLAARTTRTSDMSSAWTGNAPTCHELRSNRICFSR